MENLPKDFFVTSMQFTPTTHRDVYPAIDPTTAPLSQAGKVIAITGATRGLGKRAFVNSFAKAGPKGIVLIGRSASSLAATKDEVLKIDPKIDVLEGPADLHDPESIKELWGKIKEHFGHVDVLVNNATVLEVGTLKDTDPAQWWQQIETNVRGTYLHTHYYLNLLPSDVKGTLINLSSSLAYDVNPYLSSHSLSKLDVLKLAAFVSAENPNVTALAMHPGIVLTDATMDSFKRFADDSPELVGGMAVWAASQGNSGQGDWLKGRYLSANWDVTDLEKKKDEIVKENSLTVGLMGKFGKEQFQ